MERASDVSPAERQRGLVVLLISTFMTWAGFFVVVPLISVYYVDRLGWAASTIGLVLAIRQFTQQGSTTISGVFADRLGAKWLICAGMLLRAVGFVVMSRATTPRLLILSAVLAALGGGLFEAPKAAAIAALTDESNRRRYYSLVGVAGGLGVTIGTQIGALLIRRDFAIVCLAGAACFLVIFVLILVLLPNVRIAAEPGALGSGLARALRDRRFVVYTVLLMGYWFMWTQFSISVPLRATGLGDESSVAWVYAIQSTTTILLGYLAPRALERWLPPIQTLVVGLVIAALGFLAMGLAETVPLFFVAVFVASFGAVLTRPSEQTVTANLANPAARGSYFGVSALSLAVGGGAGNYAGGLMYDAAQSSGRPAVPWLVFAAVGLSAASGLWFAFGSRRGAFRLAADEPAPAT